MSLENGIEVRASQRVVAGAAVWHKCFKCNDDETKQNSIKK